MRLFERKIPKWLICAVCAGAAALVWLAAVFADVFGIGAGREIMVNIPEGSGLYTISQTLGESGVIRHPLIFRLLEKIKGKNRIYQQGGHLLESGMSYEQIAEKLTMPPEVKPSEAVKALIPEGYELRNITDALEEKGLIDRSRFEDELEKGKFDYDFINEISRKKNRLEG